VLPVALSDTVVAGLFGLAGLVLGVGTSYLTDRRAAKRERDRQAHEVRLEASRRGRERQLEADRKRKATRVTAMILQGDLAQAARRYRLAKQHQKYWSPPFAMPTASWSQHREVIADALDGIDDWGKVNDAFRSLATSELQAARKREMKTADRPPLDDFGNEQTDIALERIEAAIEVLVGLSEQRPDLEPDREEPDLSEDE
jgi:hypothetical protein